MRIRLIHLATLLCTALLCSCSNFRAGDDQHAEHSDDRVKVYFDGDVKKVGWRPIRKELSKESILEASEGFAGLSMIQPKSVTLTRGEIRYKIPFDEMGRGKWKGFLLDEGDKISVERIFF